MLLKAIAALVIANELTLMPAVKAIGRYASFSASLAPDQKKPLCFYFAQSKMRPLLTINLTRYRIV